jgi:putative addiction module component (TIGR02574 family)
MIALRETIVRDALQLPEGERVRVVQDLLDSLSPEASEMLDDAWAEELDRRFAIWEADPSAGIPWSELKSQR